MSEDLRNVGGALDRVRSIIEAKQMANRRSNLGGKPLILTERERLGGSSASSSSGVEQEGTRLGDRFFGEQVNARINEAVKKRVPEVLNRWINANLDEILEKRLDHELSHLFRKDD